MNWDTHTIGVVRPSYTDLSLNGSHLFPNALPRLDHLHCVFQVLQISSDRQNIQGSPFYSHKVFLVFFSSFKT